MEHIYLLEILVIKLCIKKNSNPRLSVECQFGNIGKLVIENVDKLNAEEIKEGNVLRNFKVDRFLLFPMKPEDLLNEFIRSPLILTVLRQAKIIAMSVVEWDQSFLNSVMIHADNNTVPMPLNLEKESIVLLDPNDDESIIGSIDFYIRLSCMGKNVMKNFQVAKKFVQNDTKTKSDEDLHAALEGYFNNEKCKEVEKSGKLTKKPSTKFSIKLKNKKKSSEVDEAEDFDEKFKIRAGIISSRDNKDTLPNGEDANGTNDKLTNFLNKKLMEYIDLEKLSSFKPPALDIIVGYQTKDKKKENTSCNLKTCPEQGELNIACSILFGPGQAKSKFCIKSKKKPLVSNKIEKCTRDTCRAYHPCLPTGCGPCETYGETIPGICCRTPGKICPRCGGYSITGRTCMDIPGARFIDKKPPKKQNKTTFKDINPFKCRNECKNASPKCTKNLTGEKCIFIANDANSKPKKLKQNENKYVYTAGDQQPIGPYARHKFCNDEENHVPKNMGWLWSYRPNVARPYTQEYKPGYVPDEVKSALKALPKPEPKNASPISKEFKASPYVRPKLKEKMNSSANKEVHYITVLPTRNPFLLKANDDPFLDHISIELKLSKCLSERGHHTLDVSENEVKMPQVLQELKEACRNVCNQAFDDIFFEGTSEIDGLIDRFSNVESDAKLIDLDDGENDLEDDNKPISVIVQSQPNFVHADTQFDEAVIEKKSLRRKTKKKKHINIR